MRANSASWRWCIFEQAMLAEGAQLPDPGAFVQRLNRLWIRLPP